MKDENPREAGLSVVSVLIVLDRRSHPERSCSSGEVTACPERSRRGSHELALPPDRVAREPLPKEKRPAREPAMIQCFFAQKIGNQKISFNPNTRTRRTIPSPV